MFFVALGFCVPLVAARIFKRFERIATGIAMFYPGIWGLAIWVLVIVSPIKGIRYNELAIVLVPFDLAMPFFNEKRRHSYALVRLGMCFLVSALAGIGVFHQPLWVPLLSVVMPLGIVAAKRQTPRSST
jgi:hypothetical protein